MEEIAAQSNAGLFANRTILVTGGTGSFGHWIVRRLLDYHPREIRVFSRDEKKQDDMRHEFNAAMGLRFVLGDVRDRQSVFNAMFNVDIIFHAAALKQVPSCEHSPFEAVLTNVVGAQNVIDCAIQHRVERFIAISTDKAVEPVNAMGMSKALQEKLVLAANHRSRGHSDTIFACVRYGNVLGSRGSVVPLFKSWIERRQPVLVTNPNMTRFMLTLDDAVDLVFKAVRDAHGGALYVRKSPAHTVGDLAEVMIAAAGFQPEEYDIREVGIRPGEKIHETLISLPESLHTKEEDEYFVVLPEEYSLDVSGKVNRRNMETTPFRYTSDMAPRLSKNDLLEILQRTGWVPGSKP